MCASRPANHAANGGLGRRRLLAYAGALPVAALLPPLPAIAAPAPGARAIAGRWDVFDLPAADFPAAARGVVIRTSALIERPPYGEARAPDGRLWFTDWDSARIGCRTPAGVIAHWPMPLGLHSGPSAIAVDGANMVYVGEFIANRIARFDPAAGRFTGAWELPLPRARLRRLAIDPAGCVWYAGDGGARLGRLS